MSKVGLLVSERLETEVPEKAKRRRFSAAYKSKILKEAARCPRSGELGALLRREGLYSSSLRKWRRQAEAGRLSALSASKRGPKAKVIDERERRIAQLERENRRLSQRAERAEALVELQKKVSQLLGIAMSKEPETES